MRRSTRPPPPSAAMCEARVMRGTDRINSLFSRSIGVTGLRVAGKLNVPLYRVSGGRLMAKVAQAPVLLLTTTGRRSGQARTAPVCYLRDGHRLAVIGSNAGNPNAPAWALNLLAHPDAVVEIRRERRGGAAGGPRGGDAGGARG